MVELTDEEIISKVQEGDAHAFGFIVERYEEKMMRYARKFLANGQDAQDIVQDAFLKAYENIQSFDRSKRFSPWLYRIAHNEFVSAIRKKKRGPMMLFNADTFFPQLVSKDRTDSAFEEKELRIALNTSLNELNVKYREPLILYYMEELSYKEIADVLQIPISTVGIRIKRGKGMLKKIYQKKGYDI